jgi:hypothetical protein
MWMKWWKKLIPFLVGFLPGCGQALAVFEWKGQPKRTLPITYPRYTMTVRGIPYFSLYRTSAQGVMANFLWISLPYEVQ